MVACIRHRRAKDDYRAVFALTEFDSDFTDRTIILAYERDGKPLDDHATPFQIIVPGEKRHTRWVRMVKTIKVLDSLWVKGETPERELGLIESGESRSSVYSPWKVSRAKYSVQSRS